MLNRIRGLLAEFSHVLPLRAAEVRRRVPELLETLPTRVARCVRDLLEHALRLEAKAPEYEREIRAHVRTNALAQRAQTRLGIGPITASAPVATVGNAHDFKNGRQFAAWLGLVPPQYSTGGKTRYDSIIRSRAGHLPSSNGVAILRNQINLRAEIAAKRSRRKRAAYTRARVHGTHQWPIRVTQSVLSRSTTRRKRNRNQKIYVDATGSP